MLTRKKNNILAKHREKREQLDMFCAREAIRRIAIELDQGLYNLLKNGTLTIKRYNHYSPEHKKLVKQLLRYYGIDALVTTQSAFSDAAIKAAITAFKINLKNFVPSD